MGTNESIGLALAFIMPFLILVGLFVMFLIIYVKNMPRMWGRFLRDVERAYEEDD